MGHHRSGCHQPQRLQRLCRRHLEGHAKTDAGLRSRWEYYTPITERAHRTGSFRTLMEPWTMWSTLSPDIQPPGMDGAQGANLWAPLKNFTAHAGEL